MEQEKGETDEELEEEVSELGGSASSGGPGAGDSTATAGSLLTQSTTKDEYRKEIGEFVRTRIFQYTQFFLHEEKIAYGSDLQEYVVQNMNIVLSNSDKEEWWNEAKGGRDTMREAIRKRRQSTSNGMRGGSVVSMEIALAFARQYL